MELVQKKGVKVVNIDAVIVAEEPKIHPHRELIRKNIAKILNVDIDMVGIKGKTKEGLGFVGKKEGIEVYAVALLEEVRVQTPYSIP
jgi:2-C-methyl-D-erythritol 2,4-cyclodiphosphate synthase